MNINETYAIIYHKEDNDGLFSMAIIYNYLVTEERINNNNITLLGCDYNDMEEFNIPIDIVDKYDNVIITDISFDNTESMIKLKEEYGSKLLWFDHHAPIIKKSVEQKFNDIKGLRDSNHSALYNAFMYFYNYVASIPDLFKVLSAWDSWSYEAENINFDFCRYVNIGVNNKYNLNPEKIIYYVYDILYKYDDIFQKDDINKLKDLGKIECDIIDRNNANLIKSFGDLTWTVNGRPACAVFIQQPTNSQVFSSCKDKVKNGIVFKRLIDGNWTISLYNTDNQHDFHCGEYLSTTKYHGGGHEGAAGCQVSEDTFIKILQDKKI